MVKAALVKLWGHYMGAVSWNAEKNLASFEYTSSFKKLGIEPAPLTMPVAGPQRIYSFPSLVPKEDWVIDPFKGLPGLLSDSLPDRYGNELINAWLARNGRAHNSLNPVELLCFIGKRGMGALEFEPAAITEPDAFEQIELDALVEAARALLNQKQSKRGKMHPVGHDAVKSLIQIGTSAGGARPKAIIAFHPETLEVRSGQTDVPKGFEHWMIKLDAVSDAQLGQSTDFGRVEMAYHKMAMHCGIEMMPCRLFEENGRAHFMTKRFDREGSHTKHHVLTWCAIEHVNYNHILAYSYEDLFLTMRRLRLSYPEAEQAFRRMVFNVLARNCDDHTKNFAFLLKKNQSWTLAPAYDICYAYRPGSTWVSRQSLSINGKREGITENDFLKVAHEVNIRAATSIIKEVKETISKWRTFAKEQNVSPSLRESIQKTLLV